MTDKKGMLVSIFENKDFGNCSNNGITSNNKCLILIGDNVPEVFEQSERMATAVLKGMTSGHLYAEPLFDTTPGFTGWMFGGSFIYSSDSRFPSQYPIPVHDRQESAEESKYMD